MLPNLAAINKKTGLQELHGLRLSETRMDTGFQRNSKAVTPNPEMKTGLQDTSKVVTPNPNLENGVTKTGYAATRMNTGVAGSVTRVTHVTAKDSTLDRKAEGNALPDLVREFMEVDGLSLQEAQAMAAISVQPRHAAEWLAMITELDALITRYCMVAKVTASGRACLVAMRNGQSLASIPETLGWFRQEVERLESLPPD